MSDGMKKLWSGRVAWPLAALVLVGGLLALSVRADDLDAKVQAAEKKRVEVIAKVKPSVVAIFANGGQGGGSGVLIDADGYALTNFHVVNGSGPVMKCGLPDGILYDAVLVGLDKVGDVALVKLLPRKAGAKFPFAKLGDSDAVKAGDWSLAMGNPFLLATDFTPTVTFGLVSGVHRYQYPAGTLLEYTDCIQIDTSINPGNSGGPLFNIEGELIGINGRGSFEKRGRVNSGVGYAISINQIKNFMGQLRAGMDTDHASVGALVESESEEGALSKVLVRQMIKSDAERRGLEDGDQLEEFVGRRIFTVNQFKNVLGLYPRGWRVPLTYRREDEKTKKSDKKQILVRLMGVQRQEIGDGEEGGKPPQPGPRPPIPKSPAGKLYEPKPGFANYHFNKLEQDRLLASFKKHGDFQSRKGVWNIRTSGTLYTGNGARGKPMVATFTVKPKAAEKGEGDLVQAIIDGVDYSVEPLNSDKSELWHDPRASGGLLMALHQWRQLLAFGRDGFVGSNVAFSHGGIEPFYPPAMGQTEVDYNKLRVDTEVLRTRYATADCKWYFSMKDDTRGQLLGFEMWLDRDEDPCEVYFSDYRQAAGGNLPHHIDIVYGDHKYASLNVTSYKLEETKK
jgi:S1-C subfamily serine protease